MAAAQTGTGKTAGFTLPILDRLARAPRPPQPGPGPDPYPHPRTGRPGGRERDDLWQVTCHCARAVVFGGVKINPQMMKLRKGVDILVATPGRLLDLYSQKAIRFDQLEVLVLDEADHMLDMGFIHDIRRILALLPGQPPEPDVFRHVLR